ncbi:MULTISPECIES: maltokinase N-terminal cap-like domain-containing protein [unclassified Streptomyces]|uniref:maltokinase N-terminal cap-like domain-containing protein n=1 Tax=unclassified Streptomyces TaxID=2593676 RepID=UPI0009A4F556|nr:1,4-alpha-glucan branching protein [Streptomyces sp. 3211]
MAIIHKTTMSPGKLELLAAWLPAQPWYLPTGRPPALARAGGFRLDDPEGEVGIEFMVVTDTSGEEPTAYHVPLTYRGAPLAGAEAALVGTTEHGVLGRRWVYDGPHDPVLAAQLLALFQGRAEPQAQSLSDTPDPTVTARYDGPDPAVTRAGADALTVTRVLGDAAPATGSLGEVTAGWTGPDGTAHRGVFASLAAR